MVRVRNFSEMFLAGAAGAGIFPRMKTIWWAHMEHLDLEDRGKGLVGADVDRSLRMLSDRPER